MSTGPDYGVATAPFGGSGDGSPGTPESDSNRPPEPGSDTHTSLTDALGCTEMHVDAYTLRPTDSVALETGRERVLVPLTDGTTVTLDGRFAIPHTGIARVPPNRPCTIGAERETSLLVVSVPGTDVDGAEPTIIDVDDAPFEIPSTSDVATAHLTHRLSCTDMKVNVRILDGGQTVPYHTEGSQEELFVPLDDAAMVIADDHVDTPRFSVIRVAPETPRSAINGGRTRTRWVMFGAPPTGGPTEWGPEAEILE